MRFESGIFEKPAAKGTQGQIEMDMTQLLLILGDKQRQLRSRPLLGEFKRRMDKQLDTLRPKHDLRVVLG